MRSAVRPVVLAFAGTALVVLTAVVRDELHFGRLPAVAEPSPGVSESAPAGEPASATPEPAPEAAPARRTSSRDDRRAPEVGETALVFGEWDRGGWADLMAEPSREATRLSQNLIGEWARVLEQRGPWSRVRLLEQEDLSGWVETGQLTVGSERVRHFWAASIRLMVVAAPGVEVEGGLFLPFGARLPLSSRPQGRSLGILLPDGTEALVPIRHLKGAAGAHRPQAVLKILKGFRRLPYQQGANTIEAVDGPGLIHLYLRGLGLPSPRTVEGLRRSGRAVPVSQMRVGDVIFFSTFYPDRLQPVLLLDEGSTFLEASPAQGVDLGFLEQKRNSRIVEVRRYS